MYEEGFSDDDFPKKVWDKYCENNPEFKLQGERENIRINVGIKGQEGTTGTPLTFRVDNYDDQKYQGNILIQSIELDYFERSEYNPPYSDRYFFDYTIKLYDLNSNTLAFTLDGENYDHIGGGAYVHYTIDNHVSGKHYDKTNKEEFFNDIHNIGILNTLYYADISVSYDYSGNNAPSKDEIIEIPYITIKKDIQTGKPAIPNIASADIKLKQLSNNSSFNFEGDYVTYSSNYGAEYVSGIVSNKLDKNKMWEYLGKDIKCLVPARIDLLLPYDISLEEFPSLLLPSYIESSLSNNSTGLFMAAVAFRYVEPENLTDEEILNSYRHYLNLESPYSFGVYQRSEDLKVNKLIEEDHGYLHMLTRGENNLNYNAWIDTYPRTYHIKTQAYYDLLKKFGYEITK